MNDSVKGRKLSPLENDTNESIEQNIDQNSSDEYVVVGIGDEISAQNASIAKLNEEKVHPDSVKEMNRSSVKKLHLEKDKLCHQNRPQDELKVFFGLFLLRLAVIGLTGFFIGVGLKLAQTNSEELGNYKASAQRQIEDLQNSLDAEFNEHDKTEGELNSARGTLEELDNYKASTQQEIEDLRNSLDVKTKQQHKTESELKLAKEKLEELFRKKAKTENDPNRHALRSIVKHVVFTTMICGALIGLHKLGANWLGLNSDGFSLLSLPLKMAAWLGVSHVVARCMSL